MANEAELRAAVIASPDDDEPRLAYASWCDPQPEPARSRGTFIRTQIALVNLRDEEREANEYTLRNRSGTLARRYGSIWEPEVAGLVDGVHYDRGFIELVKMPAIRFLERAQRLKTVAPIRHLTLTDVREVAEELFRSPHLATIRSLDLRENDLGDAGVRVLAESPYLGELRWLSLAWNRIGFGGAAALAQARSTTLARLEYVWLHGNDIEPNEQYAHDSGIIVESWLPPDGVALEMRYGRLPWLHYEATTVARMIPDRFRIGTPQKAASR